MQTRETKMATVPLLTDAAASPEARAVFDDIRETRATDYVNNFWRAMANEPDTMATTEIRPISIGVILAEHYAILNKYSPLASFIVEVKFRYRIHVISIYIYG